MASKPSDRFVLPALVLAAAALLILLHRFYHDDAYIVLRYAQNLLDGHGPVWNPGERVEGYTSLLWVLSTAGLGALGFDLEVASRLLGVLALAGVLILLIRTQGRAGLLASCVLALCGPIVAWSLGGLETVGFALLLTAAMLAAERVVDDPAASTAAALRAGALLGFAELCRPEAALFVVPVVAALLFFTDRSRSRRLTPAFLAGFAPVVLAHLAFRLAYYGDWLPNTFYAKAPGGLADAKTGAWYLLGSAIFFPGLVLLGAVAARRARGSSLTPGERMLGLSVALYLAYVVWVGGDHMQWFRFVVPVLPVAVLLACRRLVPTGGSRLERSAWALTAAVCGLNLLSTLALAHRPVVPALDQVMKGWKYRDPAARWGTLVGRHIRDAWPADALVALNTAGSTPYVSGLRCIDMLGLNDKQIAHRRMPEDAPGTDWGRIEAGHLKGDGSYVLSREPDFIILGGAKGDVRPWFAGDLEILRHPAFHASYQLRQVPVPTGPDRPPFLFRYFERYPSRRRASRTRGSSGARDSARSRNVSARARSPREA